MADALRQRPGDQPLPVRNDSPDIQSMVIEDLQRVPPWQIDAAQRVATDVAARREVGISRYGTALQSGNGRDAARDLYEELLDASVYARQILDEGSTIAGIYVPGQTTYIYDRLLNLTMGLRDLMDGRETSHA